MDEKRYRIIRIFKDDSVERRTIKTGLTLAEAQAHCKDPETSSRTATGPAAVALTKELGDWMDAFTEESPGDYSEERTGPGSRYTDRPFPLCLLVQEGREDNPRLRDWTISHNQVVASFAAERNGRRGIPSLNPSERAILTLAAGIDGWCSVHGADGFGGEHVVAPLFQAYSDALNYDLGRLDGGTLSGWACDRLRSLGINPDTYERI